MPKLSDSMADAVIIRWLKSPGDAFERGEGLIEVETDKATVVYEAESDGTLASILVPEGATVAVGEPIATPGERRGRREQRRARPRSSRAAPRRPPSAAAASPSGDGSRRAAPERDAGGEADRGRARRSRSTASPEPARAAGSRVDDVTRAAAEAGRRRHGAAGVRRSGKGEVRVLELTPTQSTIARRMVESATTIPVFTVSTDIDVSLIVALRREARETRATTRPSLNDFVVKAAATSAARVSAVQRLVRRRQGRVLLTRQRRRSPSPRTTRCSCPSCSTRTRSRWPRSPRTRDGWPTPRGVERSRPDDLHDGTFTVSNLGMFGVRSFTAIIDPPQVAILAVGGARRAPFEDGPDRVAFRDLMTVNLTLRSPRRLRRRRRASSCPGYASCSSDRSCSPVI